MNDPTPDPGGTRSESGLAKVRAVEGFIGVAPAGEVTPPTQIGTTPDPAAGGPGHSSLHGFAPPGYEILGELGRGGMGVVYRARHLATGEVVALKTLQRLTPATLYRFKQEFRVVAGLADPNLITLRELVSGGDVWFFTMELLEGVDLRTHLRRASPASPPAEGAVAQDYSPEAVARVREALGQLASGIAALHDAGVLHRDVKPGNVLVTTAGRVVLLDFGLAGELTPQGLYHSTPGQVCGTVAYMAPEQAAGDAVSPAADWYAFGVVLYEFLAGRLPFAGSVGEVLLGKQRYDPPPPSQFQPGVPPGLERLCMDLLDRDPARRPRGAEVRHRLGLTPHPTRPARADRPAAGLRLFGREPHLRGLEEAFAHVSRGAAVCARVHGPSGSGKSALARALLDRLAGDGVVALVGRCYEQELVPYKAFDGVVDALSRHLEDLPGAEAAALLPRDVAALARLFPVLGRVPAVAAAPAGRGDVPDAREARRRGLGALRELLARLGDRRPLVVFVDDFQWADADSAFLLEELLRPPDPPALMALLCYRSEDADGPAVRAAAGIAPVPPSLAVADVPVGPLGGADARGLAEHLLGGPAESASGLAEVIAREAAGNPFYVGELAEAAWAGLAVAEGRSLDQLLWLRVEMLPPDARNLLEVVSVAGRPVRQDVARRAAGVGVEFHAAQAVLRAGRLLRGTGPTGSELVAPYHDRVREAVLANLPPEPRRGRHLAIASAAEAAGGQDPEFLAVHFHGGGEKHRAAGHYAAAGGAAAAATAFDQSARLYRLAADLGDWTADEAARLRVKEADALANAGRGGAAAESYLAAATAVGGEEVEWRRRAAEQYLISGHLDAGVRVMREVVSSVGLTYPATPFRAILGLLWGRLGLRLRGSRPRPPGATAPEDLRRIDVCWSASTGLSVTDTIRGAYFQTRGLLLALRAGEPVRIARALALDGVHAAVDGPSADPRVGATLDAAEAVAAGCRDPYARAIVTLARGMCAFLAGRFRGATALLRSAEQTFRDSCTGVTWELDTCRTWWLLGQIFLGGWAELAREWPALLLDARDRGDLYAEVYLSTFVLATARLAEDQPDLALSEVAAAIARWTPEGFHVQHHNALVAEVLIRLYQGDGASAWGAIRDKERLYRGAMLWRVQQVRIDFLQLRARSALAAAPGGDPGPLLRSAAADARALGRESAAWGQALGTLMQACVDARGDGRPEPFALAAAQLEAADLGAFAAAARYRQGERASGDEGRRLRDEAVAWLAGQGVRDPLRMIRSHTPTPRDG